MSDFEKWFRSLNANGKTVYFLGNEHKVSEMAWNHQQAIIDNLKAQLNNMEACYIEKKKRVEELQKTNISLEAGLRKNSKNKQRLLGKNIELQKRIDDGLQVIFECRVIGADRIYTCDMAEKALRGGS